MNNADKIEKLLEELSQEGKNAQGALMALDIVPCSGEESTIIGRSNGKAGRIAAAIFMAEKDNEVLQEIRDCYKFIENKIE